MNKSFHITNQAKAQQLDEADSILWAIVKSVLCSLVLVFVFKSPDKSMDSVLAIELPAVSLPALESNPNENRKRFTSGDNPYRHDGSTLNLLLDWIR